MSDRLFEGCDLLTSVKLPGKLEAGCSLTADPQGNYTMWQGGMKPGKVSNMPGNAVKLAPGSNKIEFRFDKATSGAGVYVRVIPLKKIAESK